MNRRQFVQAAIGATASIGLAGCPGSDSNRGGSPDIDGPGDADVSVAVGRNAPENQAPYEDSVGEVSPQESDALALGGIVFQRAGERGLVVAGDATNVGDSPLELVNVEVVLYDRDEEGAGVRDSTTEQIEHGRLDAGDTWQWAAVFGSEPAFPIDYFTVQALANFA